MRQANTTFVNLRAALDDLDPLIEDTGEVAPDLAPFLRRLRPVSRDTVPVVRDLRLALSRSGPNNDITDSLRTLPGAQRAADEAVPRAVDALDESQHLIEFVRPYSPDLLAVIGKLGAIGGYYDLNGHYLRGQPAAGNVFDYNEVTGVLDPIPMSQQYDAFGSLGTGPFTRCPGGATQANVGWPTPTDHPFLDDGALTGDCNPDDVPPGP
jgi:phospholipid/cholesterol/gamma-HCH transport system substrate-binding protein